MTWHKPFYSNIFIVFVPPFVIFFVNLLLIFLIGGKAIEHYSIDKLLHCLGGSTICLSGLGILWHLKDLGIVHQIDLVISYCLVFGLLCFSIICWELIEYFVGYSSELLTYADTISDITIGLVSGITTLVVLGTIEIRSVR